MSLHNQNNAWVFKMKHSFTWNINSFHKQQKFFGLITVDVAGMEMFTQAMAQHREYKAWKSQIHISRCFIWKCNFIWNSIQTSGQINMDKKCNSKWKSNSKWNISSIYYLQMQGSWVMFLAWGWHQWRCWIEAIAGEIYNVEDFCGAIRFKRQR